MRITLFLSLLVGLWFVSNSTPISAVDVTDQVNKTVTLAPGSNVRISGINGRVNVESGEGDKAEINVSIKASSQEALERRPLIIERTANSLVIKTEDDREGRRWGRDSGWVRHEVRVKLPRNVNLKVSGVNGGVNVGDIAGSVNVSGVNGRVEVAHAGTSTELSGINGHTSISLDGIGERGLRVSGINGGVSIGLPAEINANVDVNGINGGIDSDLSISVIGEMKRGQLKGTLGAGGPSIHVSGINGGVNLKRN
jgi:hypothetical protein